MQGNGNRRAKRTDIESLKTILLAIERVERKAKDSVMAAEQLDHLYMALKTQASAVTEIQAMEELSHATSH